MMSHDFEDDMNLIDLTELYNNVLWENNDKYDNWYLSAWATPLFTSNYCQKVWKYTECIVLVHEWLETIHHNNRN